MKNITELLLAWCYNFSAEYDYELWLRNDLYTNKHTQWYYFRVSNTKVNQTYRFTIVNLMKVGLQSWCNVLRVMPLSPSSISIKFQGSHTSLETRKKGF